jgi:hypothetical protein
MSVNFALATGKASFATFAQRLGCGRRTFGPLGAKLHPLAHYPNGLSQPHYPGTITSIDVVFGGAPLLLQRELYRGIFLVIGG